MDERRAAITVGTFDGVHRGHRRVLDTLANVSAERRMTSTLVTFQPHPLQVLRPDAAPALLTSHAEKMAIIAGSGIDRVAVLRFDRALADYSPERFVHEVLIARFRLAHLVVGYDHGFGRDRSGDPERLAEIGRAAGFDVTVVPPARTEGDAVSSTRIRRALLAGDLESAAEGLGRAYSLRGNVIAGDGIGRTLGYPTANLRVDEPLKLLPPEGIYAVRAWTGSHRLDGLLHRGPRPTFDSDVATLELHLLDFDGDLYGRTLEISFCAFLRGIERFDDAAELVTAMRRDEAAARALFSAGGGACRDRSPLLQ